MSETGAGAGVTFPYGGAGESHALLRSADWSSHPLGLPDGWPARLQVLVDVCAGSAVPMAVWWRPSSPDGVVLCNDACRDLLGSDGTPAEGALRSAWPELDGLVADVLATGACVVRDAYCLAPVRGDDGAVVAVHLVALPVRRPADDTIEIEDDALLTHVQRLCGGGRVTLTAADANELVAMVRSQAERARARQRAVAQTEARVSNLEAALRSNRRIGQAIGILMAGRRITEQQAFELLRNHSQHTQRKLREVAEDVTFTGDLPPTPGP